MLPFRLSIVSLLLVLLNTELHAQQADSTSNAQTENEKQLKEIVIFSAEKRKQLQLKSPSSLTYIGVDQIQQFRIWDINNLTGIAPNLTLSQSGDNRNVAAIRGIVTTSYDQTVATYIDGVAQFNLDTYIPQLSDIESIEILRGPQGTFYGRNSMGGVINITTKKPSNITVLNADATFGNFGQKRITAVFKAPIIKNKLYFSASVLHDVRKGYYKNDFTDKPYDDQRQNIAAIQLKYNLNKTWTIQADVKHYRALNDGAFPLAGDYTTALSNAFHLSQNQLATMHDQTNNASVILQHKGSNVNFSLQSSYQNNYRYYDGTLDADFSTFSIIGIYNNYGKSYNNVKAYINELKFQSANTIHKKWIWATGIYQFTNNSPTKQATVFGKDAGFIGVPDKNFSIRSYNIASNNGIAGYAHTTYHISDKISIQGGIRLDYELKKLTVKSEYEKQPFPSFTLQSDTSGKTNFMAYSPRVGISYAAAQNQLLYLTASRGFRAGGLSNISSDPSQAPLTSYLPEFSTLYELGWKGINQPKTFQYAFAVFYNRVTNIQTPFLVLPDGITITKNAGILNSSGLEWELTSKPLKGLIFQYNGGLTNAKYQKYTTVINGSQIELNNKKQIFTPGTTHFLSGTYQHNVGKFECWTNLQYLFYGKQYFDIPNVIEQKAYGLLHAQAGIKFSKFGIYVWARNLSDKKYFSYGYDFGAVHLGNPRTFGVGLSYKFL